MKNAYLKIFEEKYFGFRQIENVHENLRFNLAEILYQAHKETKDAAK